MAIISLTGIRFFGHHGVYPEEEALGREFVLDVQIYADIEAAAEADDLSKSINYEILYHICHAEFKKPARLLETVAQRMINRIQDHFEQAKGVKLKLRKMNPPLSGPVDEASVVVSSGIFGLPTIKLFKELKDIMEELEDLLEP